MGTRLGMWMIALMDRWMDEYTNMRVGLNGWMDRWTDRWMALIRMLKCVCCPQIGYVVVASSSQMEYHK